MEGVDVIVVVGGWSGRGGGGGGEGCARSEEVRGRSGLGGVGRDRRGRAKACSRV